MILTLFSRKAISIQEFVLMKVLKAVVKVSLLIGTEKHESTKSKCSMEGQGEG